MGSLFAPDTRPYKMTTWQREYGQIVKLEGVPRARRPPHRPCEHCPALVLRMCRSTSGSRCFPQTRAASPQAGDRCDGVWKSRTPRSLAQTWEAVPQDTSVISPGACPNPTTRKHVGATQSASLNFALFVSNLYPALLFTDMWGVSSLHHRPADYYSTFPGW